MVEQWWSIASNGGMVDVAANGGMVDREHHGEQWSGSAEWRVGGCSVKQQWRSQ
jgi:hypothetical protein